MLLVVVEVHISAVVECEAHIDGVGVQYAVVGAVAAAGCIAAADVLDLVGVVAVCVVVGSSTVAVGIVVVGSEVEPDIGPVELALG